MYKIILACFVLQAYGYSVPILPQPALEVQAPIALETFDLSTRIVGGKDTPISRVPYQVSLRSQSGAHFCGGSILNKQLVLTAAHCTVGQSAKDIIVVVGTANRQVGGDHYKVDSIIIHEKYDNTRIKNDVSLIRVSEDIQFNDNVQPIQLPERDTAADEELVLSGWGRTSYPGNLPVQLQIITLKSLSVERCQRYHGASNSVDSTQICTLTKSGEGACHGDSGGPLVSNNSVVGVVSWGRPCARGYPDVYTRVFSFKDWIQSKMSTVS